MAALSRTDIQLRLEEASEKLLSRPQAVSTLERNEAEKIFLSLRAENSPYDLCQYLLENSRVDYVQFQALSAVREAFLREWESLPVDFIAGLWWYLLQFLTTQHQKLASYVLKETLHVISILVKRSMVHGKGVLQQVLSVVFDIIRGQKDSQHIGYSLLIALLSEFSSTTGPDQRGLSLQYCVQCKKALEEGEMKEVFSLILQVLKRIVTMTTEDLTANLNLISLVIELAHQILTWEFTGRLSTCKGFASQALYVVPLKPPSSWKDLISQPSIIELFFALLLKVETSSSLSHMCIQCLSQLASLTGPSITHSEDKLVFVQVYIQQLVLWMSRPGIPSGLLCSVMAVCRRLLDTFSIAHVSSISEDVLSQFVSLLSSVSVSASKQAASAMNSEATCEGEEMLESVLGIWVRLVSEPSLFKGETLAHFIAPVVEAFLKSKLTAPEGWREECGDSEEFTAGFEDDKEECLEQLQSVCILAREIPFYVLPQLVELMCSRISRLVVIFLQPSSDGVLSLNSLFEDLHWLMLVSGHIINNVSRDEASLIPHPIMSFSMSRSKELSQQCDVLHELIKMESQDLINCYHQLMSSLDPVIAVPVAVLQWCQLTGRLVAKETQDMLSPQVVESALWFLTYWTRAYLGFKEAKYDQVSLSLLSAFGEDSPLAVAVAGDLVEVCVSQLSHWPGEETLTRTACQLLQVLLAHQRWRVVAMESPSLWVVLRGVVGFSLPIPLLYPSTQHSLVVALATASPHEKFFSTMMEEFIKQVTYIISAVDESRDVLSRFLYYLEFILGVTEGCTPSKVPFLFDCLLPVLRSLLPLLKTLVGHSEAVLLILQVFSHCSEHFLPHLPEDRAKELFRVSLEVLQLYSVHNTSKYREGTIAEEEQCGDIVECLRLVQHLSTKDTVGFVDVSEELDRVSGEVILCGISLLLPLINEDLIQYPLLSDKLFSVVCSVCEMYSEEIVLPGRGHFEVLLPVLNMGFLKGGPEVCANCANAVCSLGRQCSLLEPTDGKVLLREQLNHFVPILQVALESTTNEDLKTTCRKAQASILSRNGGEMN